MFFVCEKVSNPKIKDRCGVLNHKINKYRICTMALKHIYLSSNFLKKKKFTLRCMQIENKMPQYFTPKKEKKKILIQYSM